MTFRMNDDSNLFQTNSNENIIEMSVDQITNEYQANLMTTSQKRSFDMISNDNDQQNSKKLSQRSFKKTKLVRKMPFYTEGIQPSQVLNELHTGLQFEYNIDTSLPGNFKHICKVSIKIENEKSEEHQDDPNKNEIKDYDILTFTGSGVSKKEAKRKCCNLALASLYPETYKLPEALLQQEDPLVIQKQLRHESIKKRISKLFNNVSIQKKSSFQLLHELSSKIAETAKILSENSCSDLDKKFCVIINNLNHESLVDVNMLTEGDDNQTLNAIGFGRNKKEAKNKAANQALKQFFSIDINSLI